MPKPFQSGDLSQFERFLSAQEQLLEDRLDRSGGSTGGRVVIVAPGGEIDGVEDGTTGDLLGVLLDLSDKTRAAIRLDDNGETVYVPPQSVRLL